MSVRSPRNIVLVIIVAAALYLLGNASISLWDRDEPRYAQTSRQMLQSGDWVVPRYLDKVRTAKPVFIYWCQALSMKAFGDQGDTGVFAARFPSAVAMTIVLVMLAVVLWKNVGPERTFWTLLILATSGLVLWSAKACTTDAVLLVGITISQLCLYAIWQRRATWPVVIALALGIAEAGLTKGPVVLGVMAMTLLMLGVFRLIDRRRATDALESEISNFKSEITPLAITARVAVCIAIVALLVVPWIYLVQQRESHFLGTSVTHDVLKRIAQPLEGHKGPPGYHLALVFGTFFPWSLLLPMAIVSAWKNRADPQIRFALAAVLGPWIMFELVRTKLPHYMLPTFPPLAFLTADAVVRCLRGEMDDLRKRAIVVGAAIIGFVAIALGGATIWASHRFAESIVPAIILTAAAVAFAAIVVIYFHRGRPQHGLLGMGVGVAAIYAALFGLYLPRASFLHVSKHTADVLHNAQSASLGNSEMMDYKEPSLAFYEGGNIRENSAMTLSADVPAAATKWLVVTEDVWKKTPPDVRTHFEEFGSASGLAYADSGRVVEVKVLRKR